ncbi:type II toxin-antitoxin system Phd/YefM family antitoxin [Propionivibrio sp.]|uniref:type II toxin-antitoxin system Phd/YefM family antitoxin n=1 Tax=Propionivibrio sp. TaxID=2212460 RepID=UPI003BEFB8DF
MKTFTATEAKNNFGAVIEALSHSPVRIERNGLPVAVVVSAREFEAMDNDYAMTKAKASLIRHDPLTVAVLTQYSNAEIGSVEAANKLGLKFHGQLLDLLGLTDLPFPSLPADRIDAMVSELLSEAG